MTLPRRIIPGTTWFSSRRAVNRFFLFNPDARRLLDAIYWFVTAVVAAETGIELNAAHLMSNHLQETLTDVRGCLPRFLRERNRLLANAVKCLRHWPEEVFNGQGTNYQELLDAGAAVKQIAYNITQAVDAGIVRRPEEWPGVHVVVNDIGKRVVRVKRPDVYFDPENPRWPEWIEIPIKMPPVLLEAYETVELAQQAIDEEVERRISTAHAKAKAAGHIYPSKMKILRTKITARANSYERFGARLAWFVAAGNRQLARAAVVARRTFLAAYRRAFDAFRLGERTVEFPPGTWQMRVVYGARVASLH